MTALADERELLESSLFNDVQGLLPADFDATLRIGVERAFRAHDLGRPPTRIARVVYEALRRESAPLRLSTVAALVHVGAGLHDDVSDGDICGGPAAQAQALLVSGVCLATLAPRAVMTLVPPALLPLGLDLLWHGLQQMAGGQRRDVELFGTALPALRDVEAALVKTGAEIGLSVALAALVAGRDATAVHAWESFGSDLGYALQLASDCQDVADPDSRDIASGARTLPIAFALHELDERTRGVFLSTLRRARDDRAAHAQARAMLLGTRALRSSLTLVAARIARAERTLRDLAPVDPAPLTTFIAAISSFTRR